jgi:hypothetical protein
MMPTIETVQPPSAGDDEDLKRRALAAWAKSGGAGTATAHVVRHLPESFAKQIAASGLTYIVLRADRRVVAVYRVRQNGVLRRMRRWPFEIEV